MIPRWLVFDSRSCPCAPVLSGCIAVGGGGDRRRRFQPRGRSARSATRSTTARIKTEARRQAAVRHRGLNISASPPRSSKAVCCCRARVRTRRRGSTPPASPGPSKACVKVDNDIEVTGPAGLARPARRISSCAGAGRRGPRWRQLDQGRELHDRCRARRRLSHGRRPEPGRGRSRDRACEQPQEREAGGELRRVEG